MDDQSIVQLYWDRDEAAIPATSEKYGSYCTAIARNILDSDEDAEECINDTWLGAWNSIPPHKPGVLSTFLGKITRNLSLNRCKHNTAAKRGGAQSDAVLEELSQIISGRDDVQQAIDRKELIHAINTFLAALKADKRSIFICRYWYFDSIPEIAQRFGKTENAVSVLLSRLRQKLLGHLSERGFDL